MTTTSAWCLCQIYHPECEAAINDQISLEHYTADMFQTVASYFNSEEGALKQFTHFYLQQSSKEREHAQSLVELQNQRGGRLHLHDIDSPDASCWENSLSVMECAFHLKMSVNQSLFDLHQLAAEKSDAKLCDFLKSHYLFQEMKFIQDLEDHIANLRQMGAEESGLAEDLCAKLTLGDSDKQKELTLDCLPHNHGLKSLASMLSMHLAVFPLQIV